MNSLKIALRANALFSSVSGAIMLLFATALAHLFGISSSLVFTIIGAALLFFAATVFYESYKQRRWAILWIIIQDTLWVIGSLVLLTIQPFGISSMGNTLIAIIALIVGTMAFWQYRHLPKV